MSSQAGRKPSRGHGGNGNNGRGGPRSSRNGNNASRRGGGRANHSNGGRGRNHPRSDDSGDMETAGMLRDEEILIAFMPFLKDDNAEAALIHETYQRGNDQRAFLAAARSFLQRQKKQSSPDEPQVSVAQSTHPTPQLQHSSAKSPSINPTHPPNQQHPQYSSIQSSTPFSTTIDQPSPLSSTSNSKSTSDVHSLLFGKSAAPQLPPGLQFQQQQPHQQQRNGPNVHQQQQHQAYIGSSAMLHTQAHQHRSFGQPPQGNMARKNGGAPPPPPGVGPISSIGSATLSSTTNNNMNSMNMSSISNSLNNELGQGDPIIAMPGSTIWGGSNGVSNGRNGSAPITLPRPSVGATPIATSTPTLQLPQAPPNAGPWGQPGAQPPPQQPHLGSLHYSSNQQQNQLPSNPPAAPTAPTPNSRSSGEAARQKSGTDILPGPAPPTVKPKREAPPPKRLWSRFEDQPGRVMVDNVSAEDSSRVLALGPRSELTAHWSLPLAYVRQYTEEKLGPRPKTLEEALKSLTVGLFRRGCTENGTQASIISKLVMGENNRSYDHWKDPATETVRGRVPFYSPRTPGYVIFRLYWEEEPLYTLGMGPSLLVQVREPDFEGSVRFILSNFKGKKSNPTSLSSLHSLAIVLQTLLRRPNESAARATWGCIQEARKVIEACAAEYNKTSAKLADFEETVNEIKKQVEEEEETKSSGDMSLPNSSNDGEESELMQSLREKTRILNSGRASCERKWRDSQQAFASILKTVVSNPSIHILLRRDLITKMRVEYELWCPLSEEFAVPSTNEDSGALWFEHLNKLPSTITAEHFRFHAQARARMQKRTIGFDPNIFPMHDILFPRNDSNGGNNQQRAMDAGAVAVFNNMSAAMGQYYQDLYVNESAVVQQRELIRERTQECVDSCGAFPAGTQVVIFGSSANGFGSPKSDLDMCLQVPDSTKLTGEAGYGAMAKLAEVFETNGMKEVDTSRLGARIPIVMFHCRNPLSSDDNDEDYVECDLSMHNTLAVLNTSLLRSYAEITPVTRVLAAIIKRWAKARDINNPARHTLSSYGYIIMLLHFLTYHRRSGNGLVSPIESPEGSGRDQRNRNHRQHTPILPNLQWMDSMWPNFPKGAPYKENESLPRDIKNHPLEDNKTVNAYFYKAQTPNDKTKMQTLFPGQDLSLAILLASFFRYYAYEFDYKRYVVSLHSTANRGLVEREVKAELDGWRNYSAALTIEDPFETFYDVAHVLRGGYYHRIRREFTIAYSKIADAASGRSFSSDNWDKKDLRNMSGEELIDWICEPVSNERDQHP